jgi:hypothetical protein
MHVFSAHHFFFPFKEFRFGSLAIEAVSPLALLNEGNLCDISFLRNDVAVINIVLRVSVASGHEPKGDLVGE